MRLTVAQKHLLEIAKALAIKPKVLILDEPTASLDQEATDMLFGRIREVVKPGTSVIYITHRLAEVRQIAQRVTVLRDGRVRGVALVDEISDADLLELDRRPNARLDVSAEVAQVSRQDINFAVESLSGRKFTDVSFEVSRGQIIGVAGVAGNGQSELMRALAGLQKSKGAIRLNGRPLDHDGLLREAAFMPSDRHAEGLAGSLTVRENATFAALDKFAAYGILSRRDEVRQVSTAFKSLAVKASSIEAPDPVAVGRQSAKSRDGARPALGAGPDRRRRADPGRGRRRARRNLSDLARGFEFGHARHRQLVGRGGT